MKSETIQILMTFLNRVDLKGAEVQAYVAVMQELSAMAEENNIMQEQVPVDEGQPYLWKIVKGLVYEFS